MEPGPIGDAPQELPDGLPSNSHFLESHPGIRDPAAVVGAGQRDGGGGWGYAVALADGRTTGRPRERFARNRRWRVEGWSDHRSLPGVGGRPRRPDRGDPYGGGWRDVQRVVCRAPSVPGAGCDAAQGAAHYRSRRGRFGGVHPSVARGTRGLVLRRSSVAAGGRLSRHPGRGGTLGAIGAGRGDRGDVGWREYPGFVPGPGRHPDEYDHDGGPRGRVRVPEEYRDRPAPPAAEPPVRPGRGPRGAPRPSGDRAR